MKKTIVSILIIPHYLSSNNHPGQSLECQAFTLQQAPTTSSNTKQVIPSSHLSASSTLRVQVGLLFMNNRHNQVLGDDDDHANNDGDQYFVLPYWDKPKKSTQHSRRKKKKSKKEELGFGLTKNEIPKYKKLSEILYSSNQKQTRDTTTKNIKEEHIVNSTSSNSSSSSAITRNQHISNGFKDDNAVQPWCANYASSIAIQKKIHTASTIENTNNTSLDPIDRAINVAKTLLNTPPEWCNESNLVYTLTLSAKILSASTLTSSTKNININEEEKLNEFRLLLLDILDILNTVIKNQKLNTRQLANVSWAIAKHFSIDSMILPEEYSQKERLVYAKNKSVVSYFEKWDLKEEEQEIVMQVEQKMNVNSEKSRKYRVIETLDEIAKTLIGSISNEISSSANQGQKQKNVIKVGEISMICWAYSTIFPRLNPPGWQNPPRLSSDDSAAKIENNLVGDDKNVVVYQSWESTEDKTEEDIQQQQQAMTIIDKLFDVMAQRLSWEKNGNNNQMINQLSWKEISTIAWAYAHRRSFASDSFLTLISQLAKQAIGKLDNLENKKKGIPTARDVSEIAWALGVLQTDHFIFSDVLQEYIETVSSNFINNGKHRPLETWSTADCVQLAVAMAHGRIDDQIFLENIFREATLSLEQELDFSPKERNCKTFQSWELSVLLWSQARLFLTAEISTTFDRFADILPQVLRNRMRSSSDDCHREENYYAIGLGAQETANLCWSLTVLDKYHSSDASNLINGIFKNTAKMYQNGKGIELEHAHQLWQSFFLLDIPTDDLITEEFVSFLKKSWDEEKAIQKASSARHKALSQTLDFMGVAHYNEHEEDIDVAIVLKTDSKWLHTASIICDGEECLTKVAVEFDGPAHFTRQKNLSNLPRALGHTVLKYKLLRNQGWTVVRVPYYEFDRIPFWASMERQRYLQRKLKTHANIKFSGVDVSEYKAPLPNKVSRFD